VGPQSIKGESLFLPEWRYPVQFIEPYLLQQHSVANMLQPADERFSHPVTSIPTFGRSSRADPSGQCCLRAAELIAR